MNAYLRIGVGGLATVEHAVLDDVMNEIHGSPHLAEDRVPVLLRRGALGMPQAGLARSQQHHRAALEDLSRRRHLSPPPLVLQVVLVSKTRTENDGELLFCSVSVVRGVRERERKREKRADEGKSVKGSVMHLVLMIRKA